MLLRLYWNHTIMNNTTFKIGDRVRIINCSSIEPYELNKMGVIVSINGDDPEWVTCVVDMGRPRRPHEDESRWWLRDSKIELVNKPNTQLLFEFMY